MHSPKLILDSNAVFDWLVFEDADCAPFGEAIVAGRICWVATQEMVDEADHVIARGSLDAFRARHDALRDTRNSWLRLVAPPDAGSPQTGRLRCSDPDDQKFIELALSMAPSILLTRDNALLKLHNHALASGVIVVQPARWQSEWLSGDVFRDNPATEEQELSRNPSNKDSR